MAAGAEGSVGVGGCCGKALPCDGGEGLAQEFVCPDGTILEPVGHSSLEESPLLAINSCRTSLPVPAVRG